MEKRVGVISLGCNKNRVDTEHMLAQLRAGGYSFTPLEEEADVIIINTCGFIEAAKQESIDEILHVASYKKQKPNLKILVTGCLSERYREDFSKELPEADGFLGVNQYGKIVEVLNRIMAGERVCDFTSMTAVGDARVLTTPNYLAYVKIAEGCNNACSYCAIPSIRGKYRSRPMDDILRECDGLMEQGAKELILIAQDTAYYGRDLYGEYSLPRLLKKVAGLGCEWIRVQYCYPERVTDSLLEVIQHEKNIVNYLDIPIQHIDDMVLSNMHRPCTEKSIRKLLYDIEILRPWFTLRTSLISGFPGETQAQHEKLLSFVGEGHFDKLGVFAYSQEDGTAAMDLPNQLPEEVKQARRDEVMSIQRSISLKKNRARIDEIEQVLVEGYDSENDIYYGRASSEAPETDGNVFFTSKSTPGIGEFVPVRILEAEDYDVVGEQLYESSK